MAKRKKSKKRSYIAKDPLNLIASVVVLFSILLKELFLYHECGIFGVGLYNACFIGMALLSLIFILSVKDAIKKAVYFRKIRGQVKNALQFIRLNSVLAFWIGVVGAVLLVFIRNMMGYLLNIQSLGSVIMFFLALSLPFLLLNSSYIGAFEVWGYSMPLNSGLIVFSVSDFLFSILCSVIIGKAGGINSLLFHNEHIPAAFSGGGAALGFLLATILTSVWLTMLFKIFRGNVKIDLEDEFGKNYESIHDQRLGFLISLGIPALKSVLAVAPYFMCLIFAFRFYPIVEKSEPDYIVPVFGTFSLQVLFCFLLPLIFAGALEKHAEGMLKNIAARDDRYHGSMRLIFLMKQFICFVLPVLCFVGLIAGNFTELLFGSQITDIWPAATALFALAAFSMLLSAYMTGFDLIFAMMLSRGIGIAAEFVYLFFVVRYDCTVMNLIISMLIYFGSVCFLDLILLNKYFVYKKQLVRHIVIPLVSLAIFALSAYFILYLKDSIGFVPAAVAAFAASFLIQSLILVLSGAVKENELNEYPQKSLLRLIGRLAKMY